MLALLGLDGALAAGNGPAQFDASVTGLWNAPVKLKAKLTGNGLDAEIDGSAEPFKAERTASRRPEHTPGECRAAGRHRRAAGRRRCR